MQQPFWAVTSREGDLWGISALPLIPVLSGRIPGARPIWKPEARDPIKVVHVAGLSGREPGGKGSRRSKGTHLALVGRQGGAAFISFAHSLQLNTDAFKVPH